MTTWLLLATLLMGAPDACAVGAVRVSLYNEEQVLHVGKWAQLHVSLLRPDGEPVNPRCPIEVSWRVVPTGAGCSLDSSTGPLDPQVKCEQEGIAVVAARAKGVEGTGTFKVQR